MVSYGAILSKYNNDGGYININQSNLSDFTWTTINRYNEHPEAWFSLKVNDKVRKVPAGTSCLNFDMWQTGRKTFSFPYDEKTRDTESFEN